MNILFTFILAFLFNNSIAAEERFTVVTLPAVKSFWREMPKAKDASKAKADLAIEIETFLKSIDLYKLRKNPEIFLVTESKKPIGLGMELLQEYDRIPANKIHTRAAGKFIKFKVDKSLEGTGTGRKLEAFMKEKKLKFKNDVIYIFWNINNTQGARTILRSIE